jgi:hypothetical protein
MAGNCLQKDLKAAMMHVEAWAAAQMAADKLQPKPEWNSQ